MPPGPAADLIKATCYFLGADAVGLSRCPEWTWYSHDARGEVIDPPHNHAISMIIDQGHETMEWASGEVILNPFLGPRLKSGVISTDMPMAHDSPIDFGLHRIFNPGRMLFVSKPINHFPLMREAKCSILMGGGIGITPLMAMAHELHREQKEFELHYSGDVLLENGIAVAVKCADGICGICKCGLVSREVEHRDVVLSGAQREQSIILCQSRAAQPEGIVEIDLSIRPVVAFSVCIRPMSRRNLGK